MRGLVFLVAVVVAGASCAGEDGPEPGEELSGGDTTVFDTSRNAFTLAARNLKGERRDRFFVGNALFNRSWITAPSSTTGVDGLGPTFNEASCSACHFKDGRGAPPEGPDDVLVGLLVRLSVPGTDEHGGPLGEPTYGGQLNHRAILGVPGEGRARVSYTEVAGAYGDGTPYTLLRPGIALDELAFGPMAADVQLSPRVAPAMVGLGLLEAVPEADLLARVDADDRDGDGISGRANVVWDVRAGAARLGRFGWKANQPTLEQQTAGAFLGDIGITSPLFGGENCPPAQAACAAAQDGGTPEIDDDKVGDVTYYASLLAVPARRDVDDPEVLRGKRLFMDAGCDGCHTPALATGDVAAFPELSRQAIRPFTDLLLHDMGEELADHRPDFLADGREWRTPPLWGVGLVATVNGHSRFLHDGRARDLVEAVLWHGGEGAASRDAFRAMDAGARAALRRFLESL